MTDFTDGQVLVIYTTTDYIAYINSYYPGRALFITNPRERERSLEKTPDARTELLVDPHNPLKVLVRLREHLERFGIRLNGIACFDCESMQLSSFLAHKLNLPYPSMEAVLASRSKFLSKEIWRRAGMDCPAAEQIESAEGAVSFFNRHGGKIVLKPLTGSGSELLFICSTRNECADAFAVIQQSLMETKNERMYAEYESGGSLINPRKVLVAEEFVDGTEYSCDFLVDGDSVEIIRIAKKWLKPDSVPGMVMAYQVPGELPHSIDSARFKECLRRSAKSLGIENVLCMLDFIVSKGRIVLLELTPRPGGDCLPWLLKASSGLDIIKAALDVSARNSLSLPEPDAWRHLVALRLFAPKSGIFDSVDVHLLAEDTRILEINIARKAGDSIILPPEDYDSWILGYAIFCPRSSDRVET